MLPKRQGHPPYFDRALHTLMSHTSANPSPPPTACPVSAPTTGTDKSSTDRKGPYLNPTHSLVIQHGHSSCDGQGKEMLVGGGSSSTYARGELP